MHKAKDTIGLPYFCSLKHKRKQETGNDSILSIVVVSIAFYKTNAVVKEKRQYV